MTQFCPCMTLTLHDHYLLQNSLFKTEIVTQRSYVYESNNYDQSYYNTGAGGGDTEFILMIVGMVVGGIIGLIILIGLCRCLVSRIYGENVTIQDKTTRVRFFIYLSLCFLVSSFLCLN